MDSVYRDLLLKETRQTDSLPPPRTVSDQSGDPQRRNHQSEEASDHQSESSRDVSEQQDTPGTAPPQIDISQPIGSLCGAARSVGAVTVRGDVETVTDEEILGNRESEDGIRSIPRFRDYHPGTPSKVSTAASARRKA